MSLESILCVVLCFLHFLFEIIHGSSLKSSVRKICESCFKPASECDCSSESELSDESLQLLVNFIKSVRGK